MHVPTAQISLEQIEHQYAKLINDEIQDAVRPKQLKEVDEFLYRMKMPNEITIPEIESNDWHLLPLGAFLVLHHENY